MERNEYDCGQGVLFYSIVERIRLIIDVENGFVHFSL